MNASDPYPVALRLLARQGRSEANLAQRLRDRGYTPEQIAPVLTRCLDLGYLDDRRFAFERAGALQRSGRAVGRRLLLDLQRRGIAAELATEALAAAGVECDPGAVLRTLLTRRYPDFVFASAPPAEKRRVVDFFLRRGFSPSLVLSVLSEER